MAKSENSVRLTEKEAARREMMLGGNMMKVLVTIALPLVFYNSIGQIFQLIDTYIAANMSAAVVSTVSFVAQVDKMVMAIGSGLSIAGGVMIARSYGKGDMEKVRRQISTIFFICIGIGSLILLVMVPLMYPFLKLMRMPDELIGQGTIYSSLVMASVIFQFINTIYFSIQKSKGNTKVIMWGNLLVLSVKTSMNILTMALIKNGKIEVGNGIYFLPIATLLSHFVLTTIAMKNFTSKKNPFRISIKNCEFKKTLLLPLFSLGLPVFLEKFIMAFGKSIVNALCAGFGPTVVGALGVSDRICGMATNPISGFQEAESSLVSNNLGNRNLNRALGFFYRTLLLNLSFTIVVFVITGVLKNPIIEAFAKGDANFAEEIDKIYFYERLDTLLVSVNSSVMGLLYGFGKTKITMFLNLLRLFVYRIPSLLIFMKVPFFFDTLGTSAVGLAMLISNSLVGLTAGIVAVVFIKRIKNTDSQRLTESIEI